MSRSNRRLAAAAMVLVLTMQPLLCSTARAADIHLGGMLPGGGVIRKQITSMRERRYENLIEQSTDFSCGAATLATLLKYLYHLDTDEQEVLEGMLKVSDPELVRRKGFSLLDMKRYVEALGMQGRGYTIGDPIILTKLRIPAVVLLDLKGYKHFVVLKKARDSRVYIGDPALGNKIMTLEDFAAAWNGVLFAVTGTGIDHASVLLTPAEPLSARKLMTVHSLLPNAMPLDFGFGHSKLF